MLIIGKNVNILGTNHASMYLNNVGSVFAIGENIPTALRLWSSGTLNNWTFSAGTNGTISAFADAGGGEVTVTDTAHGLLTGDYITIKGTTNYNGVFQITKVDNNSFKITDTWVANDATGTWNQGSYLQAGAGAEGTYNLLWLMRCTELAGVEDVTFIPYKNTTQIAEAIDANLFAAAGNEMVGGGAFVTIVAGDRLWLSAQATGAVSLVYQYGVLKLNRI